MCLVAFAHRSHPRYPLVLVANRDEFYARPTVPADWWPDQPGLLAGRDLQAGGTWLGATSDGRWAAVTNYREGQAAPGARSRGELPLGFLAQPAAPDPASDSAPDFGRDHLTGLARYGAQLVKEGHHYGGFNLLAGHGDQLLYCSNRRDGYQFPEPGIHTLSNHLLNTPWPKAELARLKLLGLLRKKDFSIDELLAVLADRAPFDDHSLPVTGVGLEMERVLSPPFIVSQGYGTRCTTALLVDKRGHMIFAEQNFENGEKVGGLRLFQFDTGLGK